MAEYRLEKWEPSLRYGGTWIVLEDNYNLAPIETLFNEYVAEWPEALYRVVKVSLEELYTSRDAKD